MRLDKGRSVRFAGFVVVFLMVSLAGCHVRLVSDYDGQIVKDAAAVQSDADALLQNELNPPKGTDTSYEANKPAYNKIAVDLRTLRTQAMSHSNNGPTTAQVDALGKTIEGLEQQHLKNERLGPTYILQKQADIDQQVSIIMRTEIDKKAGNSGE